MLSLSKTLRLQPAAMSASARAIRLSAVRLMRDPRTELDKYHGRERKTPPEPYSRKKELQKERELQKRFEEVQAMMAAERGRAPPFEQDI